MIRQQKRPGQKKRNWLLAIAALFVLLPATLWGARIPLANAAAPALFRYLGIENLNLSVREVTLSRVELERVSWGEHRDIRVQSVAIAIDWDGFSPILSLIDLAEPEISLGLSDGRLILRPWERMQEKVEPADEGAALDPASPITINKIIIHDPALQITEGNQRHTLSGIGRVEILQLQNFSGDIEFTADSPDVHVAGRLDFQAQPRLQRGQAEITVSDATWGDLGLRLARGRFDLTVDQSGAKLMVNAATDTALFVDVELAISGDPFGEELTWQGQGSFSGTDLPDQLGKLEANLPVSVDKVEAKFQGSGRVSRSQLLQLDPVSLRQNVVSAGVTVSGISLDEAGHVDQLVLSARSEQDGLTVQKLMVRGVKPSADFLADLPADLVTLMGDSFSVGSDNLRVRWAPPQQNGNGALLQGKLAGGATISSTGGLMAELTFPETAGFSIGRNVGFLRGTHLGVAVPGALYGAKLRKLETTFNLQFYPGAGLGIAGDLGIDVAHFRRDQMGITNARTRLQYSGSISTIGNPWKFKFSPQSVSVGQVHMGGKALFAQRLAVPEFKGECGITPAGWVCDLNGAAPNGVRLRKQALPAAMSGHARIPGLELELRIKGAPDEKNRFPLDGDIGIRFAGIELPGLLSAKPGRIEIGITPENLQGSLNIPSFRLHAVPGETLSMFADGRLQQDRVLFNGQAGLVRKGVPPVRFTGNHVISSGRGAVQLNVNATEMSGLLPVLKSLRADLPLNRLTGQSRISGEMSWGEAGGEKAEAVARFSDVAGDLPDLIFSGIEGEITLDRVRPLDARSSVPVQIRKVSAAGLSLENILLDLAVAEQEPAADAPYVLTMKAFSADLLGGSMRADPFTATQDGPAGTITSHIEGIDLSTLSAFLAIEGMEVTGRLDGTLPFRMVEEGDVRINNARFSAPGGGVIRFSSAAARNALQSAGRKEIDLLLQALANFHYDRLDMTLNKAAGPDGELTVKLQGANPDVLNGRRFNINITVTANADRLIRAGLAIYESSSALLWTWLRRR